MDDLHVTGSVAENASSVFLKSLGNCNSTSNWATLVDFLHHSLFARDAAELIDLVNSVLRGHGASLAWGAVSAVFHSRAALAIVVSASLVDRAGSVSDLVIVDPLEGSQGRTSVAAESGHLARDQHLWRQVDIGPGSVSGDLDAIGEDRSGSVGPAGSAVLRDVLVEDVGQVVGVVNLIPDPLLRESNLAEGLSLDTLLEGWAVGGVVDRDSAVSGGNEANEGSNSERFHLNYKRRQFPTLNT
jgi:hypothetical protein